MSFSLGEGIQILGGITILVFIPPYEPPMGNEVLLNLTEEYTPPTGNQLIIDIT